MRQNRSLLCLPLFLIILFVPSISNSGQLLLTTQNGKRLSLEYCWIEPRHIRFDIGGGTVTLTKDFVNAVEEIVARQEVVQESLAKTAITVEYLDPRKTLTDIMQRQYGISINFVEKPPQPSPISFKDNNGVLISPMTQQYAIINQLVHKPPRPSFIFAAVFFNTRDPIPLNACYVEVLDMDGKVIKKIPATLSFLDVPKKERFQKKIAPLFYSAYVFIPMDIEFWAYQFVLSRIRMLNHF